ncbi:glutamine amidotransferase subunit pdxT [Truncatella angustata]|uniref:Glutamine amidotransferase subunit pdxT n=1 Tax=Truncatella angustata TaxID=152316 RepID=A0A9P8RNA0_9PEZI|nr:glutamine amidotransferase subunit pdxT [Truncatella angustata]KAH6646575.1 glutamine amidotransferase subunit pdxT [Truncatella angustata]
MQQSDMAEESAQRQIILHGFWTRYSSWTARVELVLEHFRIPYTARYYSIFNPADRPRDERFRGRLYPMLQPDAQDADFLVDESLAICEYLAETFPDRELWPKDVKLRALARGAAAQMHDGFSELRNSYDTNFIARYTGKVPISDAARVEISKMIGIWDRARSHTKQRLQELGQDDAGFLFGNFSIADAFFWPVLWRFRSYQLPLDGISQDALRWMATMWNDPVMKEQAVWYFKQAEDPATCTPKYDDIFKGNPDVHFGQFDKNWEFSP